ncbi:PepSY domain-containing protein [uncultured Microbacterium sp.]|uniref:PepSY domain-containing protein n=1 Tax=uncultured Microbacterium sp. TaxID=191216 RepID=UPI00262BA736|nr:PepSY domain-containing protein [uncultured Microbacterium sp.]
MASTRSLAVALSAVTVLALSACAPFGGGGGSLTPTDQDAVRAVTTAESDAGGRAFALDADDNRWEVHVAVGDQEVEVQVSTDGTRAESSDGSERLDADDSAALQATTTTLADAIRIAATRASGGARVEEAVLEQEDGAPVWKVEIAGGTTVRVSGVDGSVR